MFRVIEKGEGQYNEVLHRPETVKPQSIMAVFISSSNLTIFLF